MILKNEVSTSKPPPPKLVSTLSYENIVRDVVLTKHFIGLTPSQFEVVHNFLDAVCPLETIHYWTGKDCPAKNNAKNGPESDFSSREKLFICLMRLKRGFTVKTLAAFLSTPERKIEQSHVRKIFTTFIQLMYVTVQGHAKLYVSTEVPTKQLPPKSVQDHEKDKVHC